MYKFILFFFFLAYLKPSLAIVIPQNPATVYEKLVATKDDKRKVFKRGEALAIKYTENGVTKKVRGFLTRLSNNEIEISTFNKKSDLKTNINVSTITKITKIDRRKKRGLVIIALVSIMLVGLVFLLAAGASPVAPFVTILAIIFGVLILYSLFISAAIIYIKQWATAKSAKKGWKFSVE
jgi:hypothetical protein